MEPRKDLLEGPPFGDLIELEDAEKLIRLARSTKGEEVDLIIKVAMTRGLRHPRIAIEAVAAQTTAKMAKYLLWATILAAVAGIGSAVAAFLTWFAPHH